MRLRSCFPLLALLAPEVHAEDLGLYVGGSVGSAQLALEDNYFGLDFESVTPDDSATAWKAYAGFKVLPFLAVEGGYTRFGSVSSATPLANADLNTDTLAVFARGILPLGPLHLFGKLGYHFYEADIELNSSSAGLAFKESESGRELALGAGAGFDFGALTIRAEYEVFLVNDVEDLSLISIGASYSF